MSSALGCGARPDGVVIRVVGDPAADRCGGDSGHSEAEGEVAYILVATYYRCQVEVGRGSSERLEDRVGDRLVALVDEVHLGTVGLVDFDLVDDVEVAVLGGRQLDGCGGVCQAAPLLVEAIGSHIPLVIAQRIVARSQRPVEDLVGYLVGNEGGAALAKALGGAYAPGAVGAGGGDVGVANLLAVGCGGEEGVDDVVAGAGRDEAAVEVVDARRLEDAIDVGHGLDGGYEVGVAVDVAVGVG